MVPEERARINELAATAAELQSLMNEHGWKFCFIGGLAVQVWAEPRYTKDVDLTLLTGFGREEPFIDVLLYHYAPRRPLGSAFDELRRRKHHLQHDHHDPGRVG